MKRDHFIQYLENPLVLNEASITELKSVIDAYPFFQTAHLLYTKALSNVNHVDYYSGLKTTSIVAGDRKVLYELITRKSASVVLEEVSKEKITDQAENKDVEVPEKKPGAEEFYLSEIKLVSNIIDHPKEKQNERAQDFDFAKQKDRETENIFEKKRIEPVEREKITQVELIVTPREEKNEIKHEEQKNEISPQEEKISPEEKNISREENVDDIVLNQVVNAYIEKEYLEITEIDKPVKQQTLQINPDEGRKILTQTLNEPHSFSQWLQLLSTEKKVVEVPTEKREIIPSITKEEIISYPVSKSKEEQDKLIEKIIQEEPKISKLKQTTEFFTPSQKAKESLVKDETLVTETLAWILEKQGKFPEAINAYKTLSLKYPEKSVYFASLISKIRIKQKQK